MRIGLVFGSGMTESFQTTSEDGFLFGYVEYNASDKFNVLSYSANTKIRVTRNAANNAAIVIDPDTDEILFQYLDSDNNFVTVAATESNKNLTNGQSITELSAQNTGFTTTPAGNIYSGAFIYRTEGGGVEVINLVSLEDYIKGVLPYEISPNWPEEAQKAFSIAVRSYSVRSINRHASAGFMLCNTTHCQVYRGGINATAGTNAAVDATKDLVAVFNNQVIEAVYHSSSGGVTENNSDAWGTARVAYLASVTVPHERYNTPNRANSLWTNTVSPQELYEYLVGTSPQASRFRGTLDSAIANIIINERSPSSNYIKSVTVTDRNGNSVTVQNSDTIRSTFSKYANSANMDIYRPSVFRSFIRTGTGNNNAVNQDIESGKTHILTANGITKSTPGDEALHVLTANGGYSVNVHSAGSDFIFDGRGWGHGVGLSQWGMHDMAAAGYTYDEILKTYYTGITIESITNIRR